MSGHIQTELLHDYADDELGTETRIAIDGHLHECGACRTELAALASVRQALDSMPNAIEPTRDLFPAIMRTLAARAPIDAANEDRAGALDPPRHEAQSASDLSQARGKRIGDASGARGDEPMPSLGEMSAPTDRTGPSRTPSSVAYHEPAPRRDELSGRGDEQAPSHERDSSTRPDLRSSVSPVADASGRARSPLAFAARLNTLRPLLALAAVVIIFFAAAALFFAFEKPTREHPASPTIEAAYANEIRTLTRALQERRRTLRPETVSTIEANLAIIDDAIARSRAALEQDPSSGELTELFSFALETKVDLLRRVAEIPGSERTPETPWHVGQ